MKIKDKNELINLIANGEYNYIPIHLRELIISFLEVKQAFIQEFKTQPLTEDLMNILKLNKRQITQLEEIINDIELKENNYETNRNN